MDQRRVDGREIFYVALETIGQIGDDPFVGLTDIPHYSDCFLATQNASLAGILHH